MQPMMPPATGPTGALFIMFRVITSSPKSNKRQNMGKKKQHQRSTERLESF